MTKWLNNVSNDPNNAAVKGLQKTNVLNLQFLIAIYCFEGTINDSLFFSFRSHTSNAVFFYLFVRGHNHPVQKGWIQSTNGNPYQNSDLDIIFFHLFSLSCPAAPKASRLLTHRVVKMQEIGEMGQWGTMKYGTDPVLEGGKINSYSPASYLSD